MKGGKEAQWSELRQNPEVPTLIHSCPKSSPAAQPSLKLHSVPQLPGLIHASAVVAFWPQDKSQAPGSLQVLHPLHPLYISSPSLHISTLPFLSSGRPLLDLSGLRDPAKAVPFASSTVPIFFASCVAFQPQVRTEIRLPEGSF